MNLRKINNKINAYIKSVENIVIPDVKELYSKFGFKVMGREIFGYDENIIKKDENCFNKSVKHKQQSSYMGKPQKDFYQQDILKEGFEEFREIVINGISSNTNDEHLELVEMIIKEFGIRNFVIDCFYYPDEDFQHRIGRNGIRLMELNEIHLSIITPKVLEYIFKMIL